MAVSNLQRTLFGIVYLDSDTAIVVGNHEMGRSTDAGLTWNKTLTPPAVIWDVAALSPQVVVAVGRPTSGSATVYRSTNAGVSWDTLGIHGVSELTAVSFCGPDTGFAAAPTGGVFRTVDGGITWDSVSGVPWGVGTTSISFFSPRTGLLCGLAGVVYHATPTVVSVLDPEPLPERPSLYQNYPNPFNPSTTIQFEIPHASSVSLRVYNPLGQEVATLLDGDKPAGVHGVRFDGSGLASGLYFYRLQAGDFVAVKKLLLLR